MTSLAPEFTDSYPMDKPSASRRFGAWLRDEKQWRWARKLGCTVGSAFTSHPAQTRETYLQHLWFTTKTSSRFILISVLLFLHGVFPFLFTRTASKQIERIYLMMRSRIPEARREVIKAEYDI